MKLFEQMTIIGVGLLGGSVARAARDLGLVDHVTGFGRSLENLEKARTLGVVDAITQDIKTAVQNADLVILASPVGSFSTLAQKMKEHLKPGCLVTDVGSVKVSVLRDVEPLMPPEVYFVGSHPIAGGEKTGVEASNGELLKGSKCVVTPSENTNPEAQKRIIEFWDRLGMKVKTMDAKEHDHILGAVSHLPHVVAFALINTICNMKTADNGPVSSFSGSGLKDSTRIASADPVMWRDICMANKDAMLNCLKAFRKNMDDIQIWIETGESETLEKSFAEANKHRMEIV